MHLASEGAVLTATLVAIAAVIVALFAGYSMLAVPFAGSALRLRDGVRWLGIGVAFTIGLNAVFAGAIIVVNAAIPATTLRSRIIDMVHKGKVVAETWPSTSTGHVIDRWTDCVGLSLNVVSSTDRGPMQLLRDSDIAGGDVDPCTSLVRMAGTQATPAEVYYYFRYWHGYQLLTKPLILLLPLPHLRALADVVYLLSIVLFSLAIMPANRRMPEAAVLAGGFILLSGAADEASALLHNIALAATFLGGIAVHQVARTRSDGATFIAALTAASGAGFVDLMFVSPLVPMVLATAILSALVQAGRDDTRALALGFCSALTAWIVGYLGTMALRVVVSALLLQDAREGARNFIDALLYRLNGAPASPDPGRGLFTPLLRNVGIVYHSPFLSAVMAGVALLAVVRFALGWRTWRLRIAGFFLLTASLPFVWYLVFRNHSEIHYWFTYVWAAYALISALTGLLLSWADSTASGGDNGQAAKKPVPTGRSHQDGHMQETSTACLQGA